MKEQLIFVLSLIAILSISFILVAAFDLNLVKINGEQVDCYDRYGNKIVGSTCVVDNGAKNEPQAQLMSVLIISVIGIFMLAFVYLMYSAYEVYNY